MTFLKSKLIICLFLFFFLVVSHAEEKQPLEKIYFDLRVSELQPLKGLKSEKRITVEQLAKCDEMIKKLREKANLEEEDYYRLYPYLYNAQKAFADASEQITGEYAGTLLPITKIVLQLFYPEYQLDIEDQDEFSERLSEIISKKIEARFRREQQQIHPLKIPQNKDYWYSKTHFGIKVPTMEPWALTSADEFRSPKPPLPTDPFWKNQLQKVKVAMAKATEAQKEDILFWAGKLIPDSSDWKVIADNYMVDKNVPLKKRLEVRAKLAGAICDAYIACFDSKYTYLVQRPDMLDPELKTYIPTPLHPSYPAAHSTASYTAATVLSHYFPENRTNWKKLAVASGLSRIRAGIHFPIDIQAGKRQGILVGKKNLRPLHNSI